MKIASKILSLIVVVSIAIIYSGCGGKGTTPDPVQKVQLAKLSTTWKISAVSDGTSDRLPDFTGFTLTLGGAFNTSTPVGPYTYSVSGKRPSINPWPASGAWNFGADATKDIVRLDSSINSSFPDQAINYTVSDSQLVLTFTYSGDGFAGSRANQVTGNWTFTFTK